MKADQITAWGALNASQKALQLSWNDVFARTDPWSYDDEYERAKRAVILEALGPATNLTVLELGCAEGHLTCDLAPLVRHLTAVDISTVALTRARSRCRQVENLTFQCGDIFGRLPPRTYDVIVCAEVLYYARNLFALRALARRLTSRLAPAGRLLTAHANVVADDRFSPGFDFHEIGALSIGKCFASTRGLRCLRELRTDLYRVAVFQRTASVTLRRKTWDVCERPTAMAAQDQAVGLVKWDGCEMTAAEVRHLRRSSAITVLMYHRVSDDGPAALAPYRVAPVQFEAQLQYLQRHGYQTLTLKEALERLKSSAGSVEGRFVVLTFDDGYKDFYTNAWPLLRKYGFQATVFVPTACVGARAEWDQSYGEPAELMSWTELRAVERGGTTVGSHGTVHRRLTELDPLDLQDELRSSRETLLQELGAESCPLAYPFNEADERVFQAAAQAGYRHAVIGCGQLRLGAPPLNIPRQEVLGHYNLGSFVQLLASDKPAPWGRRLRYRWWRTLRDRRTYMET